MEEIKAFIARFEEGRSKFVYEIDSLMNANYSIYTFTKLSEFMKEIELEASAIGVLMITKIDGVYQVQVGRDLFNSLTTEDEQKPIKQEQSSDTTFTHYQANVDGIELFFVEIDNLKNRKLATKESYSER